MKSKIFTVLLLVGLCSAAPTSKTPKITKNSYQDAEVIYEGNHDIVNLLIPLNPYRFEESKYPNPKTLALPLFFIEADIDENGNREYQGVYLLLNGRAEKIFENGRDFALVTDDSKMVYLAAGDGLHTYNVKNKTTTKYGTLNDSIINIAHEGNGSLYILTEDQVVYEVKNNYTEKNKLVDIVNAQQIVCDRNDNLYFSTPDRKVHIKTAEGIKDIIGLPNNSTKITLIKPLIFMEEVGIIVLLDNVVYMAFSNATSVPFGFELESDAIPTAFGVQVGIVHYYGYNKKIYQYNLIMKLIDDIISNISRQLSS